MSWGAELPWEGLLAGSRELIVFLCLAPKPDVTSGSECPGGVQPSPRMNCAIASWNPSGLSVMMECPARGTTTR